MPTKDVTLKQVARQARVSIGTVSRVLNGFPNVTADNHARVHSAVKKLGYRHVASRTTSSRRGDRRRKTGNIGVYFPHMAADWAGHPLLAAYMSGIERACGEHGYHALIEFNTAGSADSPPRFLQRRKTQPPKVDGLLINGASAWATWVNDHRERIAIVGLSMAEPTLLIPQVMTDNRRAGWEVAEYLWRQGHRRFGFLASTQHRMFFHRRQGIEEFLRVHGLPDSLAVAEAEIQPQPASRPELSLPDVTSLFDQLWADSKRTVGEPPTAIIAANDWSAAALYTALQKRGLTPGRDVSIIGFDNVVSICCSLTPALTSYAVPFFETGYVAARLLLDRLKAPDRYLAAGVQLVTGRLVKRDSVTRVGSDADESSTSSLPDDDQAAAPRLASKFHSNPPSQGDTLCVP